VPYDARVNLCAAAYEATGAMIGFGVAPASSTAVRFRPRNAYGHIHGPVIRFKPIGAGSPRSGGRRTAYAL
jgi:hypothetical protein